jgi:hypothetical protein
MTAKDELLEFEHAAWRALSTTPEAATGYYSRMLADEVLVLLPGGTVIDDRQTVIDSMGGAPWDDFDLRDERVMALGDESAIVTYRATARRGDHNYEALLNSTYVRQQGDWKLALHQQTPV